MKYFILFCLSSIYLLADATIFVYHRFGDAKHESTNTSILELRSNFEYLKKNNYEVVPLSKIIQKLKNKENIPDNWVSITIDDAYKSFYKNGLEVFKEYNYPFTLFVYVEATNSKYSDFMTWEELRDASKYGDIELHSYSHKSLVKLSNKEIHEDTKLAFDLFEKNMGYKPKYYTYPFGEYNDRVKEEIKKFGFESIINQTNGSVNIDSDIFNINRTALVGKSNIDEKIKYKTLKADWIEPKEYPKDGILKEVKVKIDPSIKEAKIFVSTHGWQNVKVNNGIIDIKLNKKLKLNRSIVAVSTDYYTISNKLIIK